MFSGATLTLVWAAMAAVVAVLAAAEKDRAWLAGAAALFGVALCHLVAVDLPLAEKSRELSDTMGKAGRLNLPLSPTRAPSPSPAPPPRSSSRPAPPPARAPPDARVVADRGGLGLAASSIPTPPSMPSASASTMAATPGPTVAASSSAGPTRSPPRCTDTH